MVGIVDCHKVQYKGVWLVLLTDGESGVKGMWLVLLTDSESSIKRM